MAAATPSEYDQLTPETDVALTDSEVNAVAPKTRVALTMTAIAMLVCGTAAFYHSGTGSASVPNKDGIVELQEYSNCPPPAFGFDLPHKGCRVDGDASSCVANNEHYNTLAEAWQACGYHDECNLITKFTDGQFYLRRWSDPDAAIAGAASMVYTCRQQQQPETHEAYNVGANYQSYQAAPVCSTTDGANCLDSRCCNNTWSTCYKKNDHWASCNATCTSSYKWVDNHWQDQGPGAMVWGCEVLGCCRAAVAECLACEAGKTKAQFCDEFPSTVGCYKNACCTADTAECLACASGETMPEYCSRHPSTHGCYKENWCCTAETAVCQACRAGTSIADYCARNAGAFGCFGGTVGQAVSSCVNDGENCMNSGCCNNAGSTCFKKNEHWASCNATCDNHYMWTSGGWQHQGEGSHVWDCQVLGCCSAANADCLSCSAGQTKAEYCAQHPLTVGCAEAPCCTESTAECLSCVSGKTVAQFCAERPGTVGCAQSQCCTADTALCLSCAAGITMQQFCSEHPGTLGCAQAQCCTAETPLCLSCNAGKTVAQLCAEQPGLVGCPYIRSETASCCTIESAECDACQEKKTLNDFCDEKPSTLGCREFKAQAETLRREVETAEHKVACCTSDTAECHACAAGKTMAQYCAGAPDAVGCLSSTETVPEPEAEPEAGSESAPEPEAEPESAPEPEAAPEVTDKCCTADTAECGACRASVTPAAFCKEHHTTEGCTAAGGGCCTYDTAECNACLQSMTLSAFCKVHPNKTGCTSAGGGCCTYNIAECKACLVSETLAVFCKENPSTTGCTTAGGGCCTYDLAECTACLTGKTVAEFCEEKPSSEGCTAEHCQGPPFNGWTLKPKGCPGGDEANCLVNHYPYNTARDAWNACHHQKECKVVSREEGTYYLHRESDPDVGEITRATNSIAFVCVPA